MEFKWNTPENFFSEGFTQANDPFGRKDLAARLTKLLTSLSHSTVILLDGRWGSGKTIFAKTWISQLKAEKIPAIYFDAFASDYLNDGFTAVSAALISAAKAAKASKRSVAGKLANSAAAVGKRIMLAGAKAGVKAATLGVIGKEEFDALGKAFEGAVDAAGDLAETQLKKILEDHDDAAKAFSDLKRALHDLPSALNEDLENPNKPLIILVDELDRCRPDFALEILESLKHFFSVENIHFVIITNKDHLVRTVQWRYGSGEYAEEYLQKFYDFSADFSIPSGRLRRSWDAMFIRQRLSLIVPQDKQDSYLSGMADTLITFSGGYNLSLREIEGILAILIMAALSTSENELRSGGAVVTLALMKVRYPAIFRKAKTGSLKFEDVIKVFDEGEWDADGYPSRLLKFFQFCLDKTVDPRSEEWSHYGNDLWRYSINQDELVPLLASSIVERFARA